MPVGARAQTKQERVFQDLRDRITSGQYGPGYRLVIDAIATEFGVSALPVREAIRRLEAEGLVVFPANAGARVAPADPAQFEDEMTMLAVLEGYATALAAPVLDAADISQLETITDEMVAAMDNLDTLRFGELNRQFHEVIYARCPNQAIVRTARDIDGRLALIRRTVFVQIPYRGRESVREHRALIKLLRQQASPSRIETAAREHKLATVESFRRWKRDHAEAAG